MTVGVLSEVLIKLLTFRGVLFDYTKKQYLFLLTKIEQKILKQTQEWAKMLVTHEYTMNGIIIWVWYVEPHDHATGMLMNIRMDCWTLQYKRLSL